MPDYNFTANEYWRSLILYGLNTATYKIALGQALAAFARAGQSHISMPELAAAFFDLYSDRLKNGRPQLDSPNRQTKMETIVALYNHGRLTRAQAIERVEQETFNDVIPRFHRLNNEPIPLQFYHATPTGLTLTDHVFQVFNSAQQSDLLHELNSRWDLLEAAFEMRRVASSTLENDIRQVYLAAGYARTSITHLRPVLNGYQKSLCFYCAELMGNSDVHVDHVIPRQLVHHDEVWNLVLAHAFCNEQKSDYLPGPLYIEKLIERNERFILSNHPIKNKLIRQLGPTPADRRSYIYQVYNHARLIIKIPWQGIRGYSPSTDQFYKTFIRSLAR